MTMGRFGFSYIGALFLILLFLPNLLWTQNLPQSYTAKGENRILQGLERLGEILTCCCALIFSDYDPKGFSLWSLWLMGAFFLMALYELWWVRYFRSRKSLEDFYSSFLGIPLAGAVLPVVAFFLLGIYGKVVWMLLSAAVLAVGHIGIHLGHKKELLKNAKKA